jgi:cellulose synthase/poly-beta-1,6-N-acetylglucosamine synthase-like glycosyltransferase
MEFAQHTLNVFNVIAIVYLFAGNGAYTVLMFVAAGSAYFHKRGLAYQHLEELRESGMMPPISVIIPAQNEEESIVETVKSVRQVDYPDVQIIVVDDGSQDLTLDRLIGEFRLHPASLIYRTVLPTGRVRSVFVSDDVPHLLVISKEHGGKADALNTGINTCRTPYFCTLDADSLVEPDALLRLMRPIVCSARNIIVSSGTIRIRNGCKTVRARVEEPRMPSSWIERFQVVEYLRSFLFGRAGWNLIRGTMIVSGAMAVFHRQHVVDAGGFSSATVGEDMELVVRLQRHAKRQKEQVAIMFSFDPVCWTECPRSYRMLARQRRRWQLGLCQTLWLNLGMFLNPRYGLLGLCSFPFHLCVESLGAAVEFIGYIIVPVAFALHLALLDFYIPLVIFCLLYASLLSVVAILLEELTYRRYPRRQDLYLLLASAMIDNFGFRQLTLLFRVAGFGRFIAGINHWEHVSHTSADGARLWRLEQDGGETV